MNLERACEKDDDLFDKSIEATKATYKHFRRYPWAYDPDQGWSRESYLFPPADSQEVDPKQWEKAHFLILQKMFTPDDEERGRLYDACIEYTCRHPRVYWEIEYVDQKYGQAYDAFNKYGTWQKNDAPSKPVPPPINILGKPHIVSYGQSVDMKFVSENPLELYLKSEQNPLKKEIYGVNPMEYEAARGFGIHLQKYLQLTYCDSNDIEETEKNARYSGHHWHDLTGDRDDQRRKDNFPDSIFNEIKQIGMRLRLEEACEVARKSGDKDAIKEYERLADVHQVLHPWVYEERPDEKTFDGIIRELSDNRWTLDSLRAWKKDEVADYLRSQTKKSTLPAPNAAPAVANQKAEPVIERGEYF
ncbi:MAG: hypothetical protein ACOY3I_09170 [Verrucomicrobiota bacterium]